jgi:hypothetical protein
MSKFKVAKAKWAKTSVAKTKFSLLQKKFVGVQPFIAANKTKQN